MIRSTDSIVLVFDIAIFIDSERAMPSFVIPVIEGEFSIENPMPSSIAQNSFFLDGSFCSKRKHAAPSPKIILLWQLFNERGLQGYLSFIFGL